MDAQTKIIRASHMIDMNDIIREGNPTLRAVAEDVTLPLSDEDIILGEKMMQFLRNSQDPVIAEKMGLRGGVGLAAPQLDISKRIIAVLVPNPEDAKGNEGERLSEDEVREYCKGQIAHYKIPRYIRFVDSFPMTVTGKIQKFLIRQKMKEELGLDEARTA